MRNILCRCNIKLSSSMLFQRINISTRLYSSSSSSSSSDSSESSDSDSDTEKTKLETASKDNVKSMSPASAKSDNSSDLEKFLYNMTQSKKPHKTVDVAMQPKKPKDKSNDKHLPFEKRIVNAAKDVAETLSGDKTKTMSDLLEKVLTSRVEALREEQANINKIRKNTKFKQTKPNTQKSSEDKDLEEKSVIRTLLSEYNKRPMNLVEDNIQENFQNKYSKQKSVIRDLLDEYNKQPAKVVEDNTQKSSEDKDLEEKSVIQTLLVEYNKRPVKVIEDNIQENSQNKYSKTKSVIRDLLDEYDKQPVKAVKDNVQKSFQAKYSKRESITQTLLDEHKKQPVKVVEEDSISRQLLNSVKERLQDKKGHTGFIDLWNGKPSPIFENMETTSPNIPKLKTWTALEQKELKALTTYPPTNVFQEHILWTEQGKLWKFPIDNEQGMEEENHVHFSEHVFMERHLKGWCPKSGPIRHFMELVCVGLSKNPYLTVEEKIRHIMWYKEYFESKQDLLQEIGAIQEPFPDKVKEITE